ncbi:MAG: hypothetical protein M1814_004567 [Vezdaea aestivalis]|nr:MAG: hypothetical protein M1814_004567 [Vezdaea aestivalis]
MPPRVYPLPPDNHIVEPVAELETQPFYSVSSRFGDAIEDEALQDVAHSYHLADKLVLSLIDADTMSRYLWHQQDSQGTHFITDVGELHEAEIRCREILERQFDDIDNNYSKYGTQYLSGDSAYRTITLWNVFSQTLTDLLKNYERNLEWRECPRILGDIMESLQERICHAASEGLLDKPRREIFRRRWLYFSRVVSILELKEIHSNRTLNTWTEVRNKMDKAAATHHRKSTHSNLTETQPKISLTAIYWSTVLTTTLLTIPTISLASYYSPHVRGTVRDADFWLLIQNDGMQMLNCAITALAVQPGQGLSTQTCVFLRSLLGLGAASVVLAWVLYTQISTEWSAMANCVPGIVQAYVLVQVFFEKKVKRD